MPLSGHPAARPGRGRFRTRAAPCCNGCRQVCSQIPLAAAGHMARIRRPAVARSPPFRPARGRKPPACAWPAPNAADILRSQVNVVTIRPHGHADGQRGQAGPELITGYRVQRGERHVASWLAVGGLAAGRKRRQGLSAQHHCRRTSTPDREVDASRDGVIGRPGRSARWPSQGEGTAGNDPVHLLDPGHKPGKGVAAQPAQCIDLCWRHRASPEHRHDGPAPAIATPVAAAGKEGPQEKPAETAETLASRHDHRNRTACLVTPRQMPAILTGRHTARSHDRGRQTSGHSASE